MAVLTPPFFLSFATGKEVFLPTVKLLILDNYDSFTFNLVHLVEKVSAVSCTVARNDGISIKEAGKFDRIILSPGPGLPSSAGIMPELLATYYDKKSILGVCLGLQAIGEQFGCHLKNLPQVFHGLATNVNVIKADHLFKDFPATFRAGRYHSWVIDEKNLSPELEVTAVDDEGLVMAARHKRFDISGVQFHPESILSERGDQLIRNWLRID
jgi:anthranilate synthase component II